MLRSMREFHVQRRARKRYGIDRSLIGSTGDLVTTDLMAVRRLANRMNDVRPDGVPAVSAGDIGAMGLIHEIGHLVIARYAADRRPEGIDGALSALEARIGTKRDQAPAGPVRRGVPRSHDPPGAAGNAPRGAHPGPRRQREPGARAAARARRRPAAGAGDALSRRHRRARGRASPRAPGSDPTASRSSSCSVPRRATPRPRSPASCATSGSAGPASWATPSSPCWPAWTWPSGSSPRRRRRSTCASVAVAGRHAARCPSSAVRTSRRRSRRIRRGCRASS